MKLSDRDRRDALNLLESSSIQWRRDWDAVLIGFMLGILAALVIGFGARVMLDEHYRAIWVEQAK